MGYGEIDNAILESLASGQKLTVLDLFCQRDQTVDQIDRTFTEGSPPFVFDHHKSTYDRYGNRKWAVVDTEYCAAMVYWRWLREQKLDDSTKKIVEEIEPLIKITNDRDLWLGEIPESRLWQGLVTILGPWGDTDEAGLRSFCRADRRRGIPHRILWTFRKKGSSRQRPGY